MLFFNYTNLFFLASGDCTKVVKLLLLQEEYPIPEMHGRNYIRNLEPIKDDSFSYRERAEYIGICSMRNHTDELFYNKTWLNIVDLPPWIPLLVLEENPLITLEGGRILFPYENQPRTSG